MKILEHVALKHLNTFHVETVARYFVEIDQVEDLQEAFDFCRKQAIPYLLIGQGSNILFRDDFPGMILKLALKGIEIKPEHDDKAGDKVLVTAQGGENWHDFVMHCLNNSCYGLENLSLIPGTVGAAPVQNIGAYGVELADFLQQLEALEISSGQMHTFSKDDCQLSYRDSIFKQAFRDKYVICSVTLRLSKTPAPNLSYPALQEAVQGKTQTQLSPKLISDLVCQIRRSKLPDPDILGNAGSFFWNPIIEKSQFQALKAEYPELPAYAFNDKNDKEKVKVPAAWLIEQAGWKGHRDGDAGVHEKHALVLVNHGAASGRQLHELAGKIQASVQQRFAIELLPEVRIIPA